MMKVEADEPGSSLETPRTAESTSDLEETQDGKNLNYHKLVIKEEALPDWSSSLDQQDPEHPHIKEEDEELRISQEEEQPTVKSEDEEKPPLSKSKEIKTEDNRETGASTSGSTEQIEIELDGEDCMEPKPHRNLDPACSQKNKTTIHNKVSIPSSVGITTAHVRPVETPAVCRESLWNESFCPLRSSDYGPYVLLPDEWVWLRAPAGCRTCEGCKQGSRSLRRVRMSEMMKVEADEPGVFSSEPLIPAASTSELEQKQDNKDLIHQMFVIKVVPHDWSLSLNQQDPDDCRIKEEEEELWISHEEEQLTVKIEDEEKPELYEIKAVDIRETESPTSSSDEKMEMEPHEEDSGGLELERNQDPACSSLQTKTTSHKSVRTSKSTVNGVQTEEKPFCCHVCGKTFKRNAHVKLHMMTHTAEREHTCDLCGKGFKEKSFVQTHMRIHTGEKPFSCNVCGKGFHAKTYLKTHMKVHSAEKPFSCDICGTRFKRKENIKKHMRIHTAERPFVCRVCNKDFSLQNTLNRHMRVHTGEKQFICNVCSKGFSLKHNLKSHMEVHTAPFSCSDCSKRFVKEIQLERHVRVHSEERPYGCNVCKSRFYQRCQLENHMRVHSGEKPFVCTVCSKGFSQLGDMRRHMGLHKD